MLLTWLAAPALALEVPHEHYELENGLDVILVEDHRLPQVVVDLWYGVGSYDDPPGESGFAHLFEHLMFMGTDLVGEGEFDGRMEAGGGWNNASTGDDRTNYFDVGPAELLDLLMFMEADRMTGLDITQAKLDLQREVVRNERRQNYEDAPYGKVWLEVPGMLYPTTHPYHLSGIGSHEDLLAATLDTVTGFYADWYAPNNATLIIGGDFDPEQVKANVERWFAPLEPAELREHLVPPVVTAPVTLEKTITDSVELPLLVMAWHTPAYFQPGDAELDILSDVLAGGADARLEARLVNEERVVQDLEVFQYSSQHGSSFYVMAFASPDADLAAIAGAIEEELAAIADGTEPVTERELAQAVNGWEMNFVYGLEGLLDRVETLQSYLFYTGTPDYLEQDLGRYKAVSAESIQAVVAERLKPELAARLSVLPETTDQSE